METLHNIVLFIRANISLTAVAGNSSLPIKNSEKISLTFLLPKTNVFAASCPSLQEYFKQDEMALE